MSQSSSAPRPIARWEHAGIFARGGVFAGVFVIGAFRWAARDHIALALVCAVAGVGMVAVTLGLARFSARFLPAELTGPAKMLAAVMNIGSVAGALVLLAIILRR